MTNWFGQLEEKPRSRTSAAPPCFLRRSLSGKRAGRAEERPLPVDLKLIEEEQRVITGEVYDARQLGFDDLLSRHRHPTHRHPVP